MGKSIIEFVEAYKTKKFMNTKQGIDEKSEWLKNELEIRSYIPFREKEQVAEMIVSQNIKVIDGIKKYDDVHSYISLIVASIKIHTNLRFSDDPIADYDLLAESGLLAQIMAEFQSSHEEIGILLKMMVAAELEDNNPSVLIGRFLDKVLSMLDKTSGLLNSTLGDLNLEKLFNEENIIKIIGLLNK